MNLLKSSDISILLGLLESIPEPLRRFNTHITRGWIENELEVAQAAGLFKTSSQTSQTSQNCERQKTKSMAGTEEVREPLSGHRLAAVLFWRDIEQALEVTFLATHADFLRMGMMKDLLQQFLDEQAARLSKPVWLEVHEQNEAAQSLYRSFEFKVVGQRPNYYKDGASSILMTRDT